MFKQVEKAMEGARIGDEVEVILNLNETFGDPELIYTDSIENLLSQLHRIGAAVEFQNEQGDTKSSMVAKIQDDLLTIEGNSPLIGNRLTSRVTIHDIRHATEKEIQIAMPAMPSLHLI